MWPPAQLANRNLAALLCLLFVLYCCNPEGVFETHLFFNELLSFAGLLVLACSYRQLWANPIAQWVLALFVILLLHAALSPLLYRQDVAFWPVYLRQFQIVYSFGALGTGFFLFSYLPHILPARQLRVRLVFLLVLLLVFGIAFFDNYRTSYLQFTPIHRFSLVALIPLLLLGQRRQLIVLLACCICLYGLLFSSATNLVAAGSLFLLAYAPNVRMLGMTVLLFAITLTIVFVSQWDALSLYSHGVKAVYNHSPIMQLDHNSGYRFVLWYQALVEHFPKNLLGLGLGTPYLQVYPIDTAHIPPNYEYSTYLAIPHNTFIWAFFRLGLPGLFAFVGIAVLALREFYRHRDYYHNQGLAPIFYAFWLVLVMGFFNSTIETRTTAALYWVPLGMLLGAMQQRIRHTTAQLPHAHPAVA